VISSLDGLVGITCKKNLAISGVHYESRWFRAWKDGVVLHHSKYDCPVGDLTYTVAGVNLGFEICEDSWVANRPARDLFNRNVDIILNPSASHFAVGKYPVREQFVKEGSRAFSAAYVYSNLTGNEEGQSIYDAGCLIASQGDIVARGKRFTFKDTSLVTAVIDINANRVARNNSSQQIELRPLDASTVLLNSDNFAVKPFSYIELGGVIQSMLDDSLVGSEDIQEFWMSDQRSDSFENLEMIYALSVGMFDWQSIGGIKGFVVSLSGGADSSLTSAIAYLGNILAAKELGLKVYFERMKGTGVCNKIPAKQLANASSSKTDITVPFVTNNVMPHVLTTIYQGTKNSSNNTRDAAKDLGSGLNSTHFDWDVDDVVSGYIAKVEQVYKRELTWAGDDIPLQNIQARARAPSAWFSANIEDKILVSTSNLSENFVGYFSIDGDSAGLLSPISGVYKSKILKLNAWLAEHGVNVESGDNVIIAGMDSVVKLKPSAELREEEQSDEDDLMPFPLLDMIIGLKVKEHRMPVGILEKLALSEFSKDYTLKELAQYIEKAFVLYGRTQVKRHKNAVGFQIECESLDPKTFARTPLMNHWVKGQLDIMWKKYEEIK